MTNLRNTLDADHARMEEEAACYGHDVAIVHNQRIRSEPDYLPWHRSHAAEHLQQDVAEHLQQDVATGMNKTMPPRDLHAVFYFRTGFMVAECFSAISV